jgi:peroxiredoxin
VLFHEVSILRLKESDTVKRKLAFIFLLFVVGAIGYLGFSIYDQLQEKQAVKERIAQLPEFSTVDLDGRAIQNDGIIREAPLILTYFNTGCEYCRAEIRSIQNHKSLQERAMIYLISDEPAKVLKQFSSEFELDSLQKIKVLQDSTAEVKELFGVKGVPNTFVYNRDGKLLKSFEGETKAEILYKLVKK